MYNTVSDRGISPNAVSDTGIIYIIQSQIGAFHQMLSLIQALYIYNAVSDWGTSPNAVSNTSFIYKYNAVSDRGISPNAWQLISCIFSSLYCYHYHMSQRYPYFVVK